MGRFFVLCRYWLANRFESDFLENGVLCERLKTVIGTLLSHDQFRKHINSFHAHAINFYLEKRGKDRVS